VLLLQFTAILGRQIRLLVSRTSSSSNAVNAAVLLLREPPGTVCQSMSPGLSANGSPSTSSLWRPRSLFTTQQQQQQHPAPGDNEHIKDIDSEQQQQQQGQYQKSFKEETQEVSKAFLTNSLNMEELWLAAVAGKLKIWSSRALPHLKVTLLTVMAITPVPLFTLLLARAVGIRPTTGPSFVSQISGYPVLPRLSV
jgi:hypothetical protein